METTTGRSSMPPAVTAEQMREVDRVMIEDLHIELIQMMENAGAHLAELAIRSYAPRSVSVLTGPGGNGGGGLVAARHLLNRGVDAQVVLSHPTDALTAVPLHQLDILDRMGVSPVAQPVESELVIDAVIGYSLRGAPRGRAAELIDWANRQASPVLSLDTPSGLDVTTGRPAAPCVRATTTMTLALPKTGLLEAPELVGSLFLADISVPSLVYERIGLEVGPIFSDSTIISLNN